MDDDLSAALKTISDEDFQEELRRRLSVSEQNQRAEWQAQRNELRQERNLQLCEQEVVALERIATALETIAAKPQLSDASASTKPKRAKRTARPSGTSR